MFFNNDVSEFCHRLGDHYADAKANSFPADKMKMWFTGGPEIDRVCQKVVTCCVLATHEKLPSQEMTQRFGAALQHAADNGLPDWHRSYNGLAAVLLMDQFVRQEVNSLHRASHP